MLRLLTQRKRWTVGELAREFGVTDRTILRDVEQLSLTKPICTEPGRHGGVWLTERLMRPMLTIRETAALYRALTVLEAEDANTGMSARECLSPEDLQIIREIIRYYGKNIESNIAPIASCAVLPKTNKMKG